MEDAAAGNRVTVFINRYKTTGTFTWDVITNPAPMLSCPEIKGPGIHDLAVRFADISGNGLSGKYSIFLQISSVA